MGDRTFVVIFFFWAALTIVTPMLVLLSESSKSSLISNDVVQNAEAVVKPRKMKGHEVAETEKKWNGTIIAAASGDISAVPTEAPQPSNSPLEAAAAAAADDDDYRLTGNDSSGGVPLLGKIGTGRERGAIR